MSKKRIIQLLLILLVLTISFSTYLYYSEDLTTEKRIKKTKDDNLIKDGGSNVINNLKYLSTDIEGNKYEIISKKGEINENDPDIIFLTDVSALINLKNADPITITSDFANYNGKNYDTYFYQNVLLNYTNHEVKSNNLDLTFDNNLAHMYKDVVYNSPTTKLEADAITIELDSKNAKIFMKDKTKKIKVTHKEK